jgi:hypothetical protein
VSLYATYQNHFETSEQFSFIVLPNAALRQSIGADAKVSLGATGNASEPACMTENPPTDSDFARRQFTFETQAFLDRIWVFTALGEQSGTPEIPSISSTLFHPLRISMPGSIPSTALYRTEDR